MNNEISNKYISPRKTIIRGLSVFGVYGCRALAGSKFRKSVITPTAKSIALAAFIGLLLFLPGETLFSETDWNFNLPDETDAAANPAGENRPKSGVENKKLTIEEVFAMFGQEQKVVIASKREQSVSDAPATVYVVTDRQIRERGYFYLRDLLRDVPGIDYNDDSGTYGLIAMQRGLDTPETNKTLVFIDGLLMNNPSQGTPYINHQYSLHNVKRVEILWGPASALYGANAFGGVINIVTKSGADIASWVEAGFGGMSFNKDYSPSGYMFDAMAGGKLWSAPGALNVLLSGHIIHSPGGPALSRVPAAAKSENPETNDRIFYYIPEGIANNPILRNYMASAKLEWPELGVSGAVSAWSYLSKQGNFASYYYSATELALWGFQGETAYLKLDRALTDRLNIYSMATFRRSRVHPGENGLNVGDADRDAGGLDTGGTLLRYRRDDYAISLDQQLGLDISREINLVGGGFFEYARVGNWNTNELTEVYDKNEKGWVPRHSRDRIGRFMDGVIIEPGTEPVDKPETIYTQTNLAGYLQGAFTFLQKITVTAGGRYDNFHLGGEESLSFLGSQEEYANEDWPAGAGLRNLPYTEADAIKNDAILAKRNYYQRKAVDLSIDTFNPRAGVVFKPTTAHSLKLLYGQAFRNPTVRERYSVSGSRIPAGNGLNPETIKTLELGYGNRAFKNVVLEADAFGSRASDIIQLASTDIHRPKKPADDALSKFQNSGRAQLLGGEVKADALLLNRRVIRMALFGNYSYQHNTYLDVTDGARAVGKNGSAGAKTYQAHSLDKTEKLPTVSQRAAGVKYNPVASNKIPRVADNKWNAGLTFYLYDNFVCSPRLNYVGERPNVITSPIESVPAYYALNMNLAYLDDERGIDFQLEFQNMLNARIDHPGTRDARGDYYSAIRADEGFSVWAKMTVKL